MPGLSRICTPERSSVGTGGGGGVAGTFVGVVRFTACVLGVAKPVGVAVADGVTEAAGVAGGLGVGEAAVCVGVAVTVDRAVAAGVDASVADGDGFGRAVGGVAVGDATGGDAFVGDATLTTTGVVMRAVATG
jgi:hypothetical protein